MCLQRTPNSCVCSEILLTDERYGYDKSAFNHIAASSKVHDAGNEHEMVMMSRKALNIHKGESLLPFPPHINKSSPSSLILCKVHGVGYKIAINMADIIGKDRRGS